VPRYVSHPSFSFSFSFTPQEATTADEAAEAEGIAALKSSEALLDVECVPELVPGRVSESSSPEGKICLEMMWSSDDPE